MRSIETRLWRFRKDERGNVGVIFAVTVLPLLLLAGAAVDYSRASAIQAKLQAATDGTALTLCKMANSASADDLQRAAQSSLASCMPGAGVTADPLAVVTSPRQITLTTHATYNTAFMKVARMDTMPIATSAGCQSDERFLEISLVLDNTGSMSRSGGAGARWTR